MKNMQTMDWSNIINNLHTKGYAVLPKLLSHEECDHVSGMYHDSYLFRNTINMKRYRFGEGEYKYFSYPLPPVLQVLREEFYKPLAHVGNDWMKRLAIDMEYPQDHSELLQRCHEKNQQRPTPLILHYKAGGHNTLHQDLYGEIYFPFQVVVALSQHGKDYEGGEFVMTEQVPRAQSKAEVIIPNKGDAVIFTTRFRPVKGSRGYYRANMKHGVSEVKSGERYALGIIFHDAA